MKRAASLAAAASVLLLGGCGRQDATSFQGYVEGEFVYVASPLPGMLETLSVERGAEVKTGDPLFTLESGYEKAARDEADRKLAEAKAMLEDAKQGQRPSEIQSLTSLLEQAQAALSLSEREFSRQEKLRQSGVAAVQELDRARSARDQDRQRVSQLIADLETARLGARPEQIAAAEANVRAQEAALARADWNLSQKRQCAQQAGLVFDTLYRQGEWVAAGRPVVVLLPPQNIKVRTFVPETMVGRLKPGDAVRVSVDGIPQPFVGKIQFISPRAEYTPPVIYSRESRTKLVFMIEAVFDPEVAAQLHPGQPVDVTFDL